MTALSGGMAGVAPLAAAVGAWALVRRDTRGRVLGRLPGAEEGQGGRGAPAWVTNALYDAGLDGRDGLARGLWTGFVVGGALVVALAWIAGGVPLATLAGLALVVAPAVARGVTAGRRHRIADGQVAGALDEVARSLRGGATVVSAMRDSSSLVRPPLADDLAAVMATVDAGGSLASALDGWVARSPRPPVRLAATVLALAAGTGAAAAHAVDRAAASLRAQHEVAAEARALSAQARYSAAVIGLAPVGFLAVVSAFEPATVDFLLRSSLGLTCLTAGLILDGLGAWWMHRILGQAP